MPDALKTELLHYAEYLLTIAVCSRMKYSVTSYKPC
ncbi:hypothetical protein [Microcystis sp. M025S2]|nr:hypothetical protein [Microcystis sp. M025S2]